MTKQKEARAMVEKRHPAGGCANAAKPGLKAVPLALAVIALSAFASTASATEDGTTHYPVGVNTVADGYTPMPGTLELYNYSVGHWSNTLANNSGNETIPGFSNAGAVDALRVMYTFAKPIGPFHYTMGGVLQFSYNHLDVGRESDSATNLGDLDFQNYLSYVSPNHKLFMYFGLDTYMPTGRYNKNHLVNPGKNYWSFDPSVNVTYHVNDKLALNGVVYAEFNTKNSATHYQSGNSVDTDFAANYRPFVHESEDSFAQHLGFGIGGYFLKQYTDDKVNGETVGPDGHRAQAFGIGPQVIYYTKFGGFALKYQHDLAVRNRAASDTVWFQFAIPLLGSFRHVGTE